MISALAASLVAASVAALEEVLVAALVEALEAVSVAATVALTQTPPSSRMPALMSVAALEEVLEALAVRSSNGCSVNVGKSVDRWIMYPVDCYSFLSLYGPTQYATPNSSLLD